MNGDLEVALQATQAAGEQLVQRFRKPLQEVRSKGSHEDLVSEADRSAEQAAREVLAAAYPQDAIVGEELGGQISPGRTWVLDPLDGTVYYVRGLDAWSVSLALQVGQQTALGVVHDPLAGETWAAEEASGLLLNGQSVERPPAPALRHAHLACAVSMLRDRSNSDAGLLLDALRSVERFRDFGSPARTLAQLAAGRLDLAYYDTPRLQPWDVQAGLQLCRSQGLEVRRLPPWAGGHARLLVGPRTLVDELQALLPNSGAL